MRKLFVAMPYAVRKAPLDYEEPDKAVEINFDAVWEGVLQPAVPTDFQTKRADELRQPGLIDRLYNEWLFDADIVLADLTFGNPNVYYELGIRQALSRKGTVLVACKGTKLPFDVRNQYVINYDYFAAPTLRTFQAQLRQAIENASGQELDSPVHIFLPGLVVGRYVGEKSPQTIIQELTERVKELQTALGNRQSKQEEERLIRKLQEANSSSRVFGVFRSIAFETLSLDLVERLAIRLRQYGYFDEALQVLQRGLDQHPQDSELLREMGFAYRKKGPAFYLQAESYMKRALELNDADAELHGMLGGLLKRRQAYDQALAHYKLAYELEPKNLYPLVNLGGIFAALGDTGEACRWYEQLQGVCEQLIAQQATDYWTFLCLGEACVALGDEDGAVGAYRKAIDLRPPVEDLRSACEQLEFLRRRDFSVAAGEKALTVLNEALASLGRQ